MLCSVFVSPVIFLGGDLSFSIIMQSYLREILSKSIKVYFDIHTITSNVNSVDRGIS